MRIRIINDKDWERSFELDKSIIRIGSQVTCDVMINDSDVPALMMQITRTGTIDTRNTMRFFAENILLTRGDQTFPVELNVPYEVLDGDKISFSSYRMITELESDKSRVRQSEHMSAEMFLSDRDLAPDSPISGGLLLKNLGTQRPCQFRMNIKGIPPECLYSSPLPYLYPGASSSVGFTISHLKTRPAPGFHTVSITLSAPDEYYGEMLEFNQDIYVRPVFDNEMFLEDDSDKLTHMVKTEKDGEKKTMTEPIAISPDMNIRDSGMMNLDESVFSIGKKSEQSVVVIGKENDSPNRNFEEPDEDDQGPEYRRKKKERVVVIHNDDDNLFEGETGEEAEPKKSAETVSEGSDLSAQQTSPEEQKEPAAVKTTLPDTSATGPALENPASKSKTTRTFNRKKKSELEKEVSTEEPQPAPVPRKKAAKFKPDVVVVHSDANNLFEDENLGTVSEESQRKRVKTVSDSEDTAQPENKQKKKTKEEKNMALRTSFEDEKEPSAEDSSEASLVFLIPSPEEQKEPEAVEPAVKDNPEASPVPQIPSAEEQKEPEAVESAVKDSSEASPVPKIPSAEEQKEPEAVEPAVKDNPEASPVPQNPPSEEQKEPEAVEPAMKDNPEASPVPQIPSAEEQKEPEAVEPVAADSSEASPDSQIPSAEEQKEPEAAEPAVKDSPETSPVPQIPSAEEQKEPEPVEPAAADSSEASPDSQILSPEKEQSTENSEKKPPVPVFSHSSGFDEFVNDIMDNDLITEDEPSETKDGKPAVHVVKGGSFD